MIFGHYCRQFRRDNFHITQKELAKKHEVPNTNLWQFEVGITNKFDYVYTYLRECKTPELRQKFMDGLQKTILNSMYEDRTTKTVNKTQRY